MGAYIETEPEAIWQFVRKWGDNPDADLRAAIATCLLEHLLQGHFATYFPAVERLCASAPYFAGTFLRCARFGQSDESGNAARFVRLQKRLRRREKVRL